MKEHPLWFLCRKLIGLAFSLWVLVSLVFGLLRFLPGGPFDADTGLHPLVRAQLEKNWHLGDTLGRQYFHYMGSLLRGDLGLSMVRDEPVGGLIAQSWSHTLGLSFWALVVVIAGALILALVRSVYRDRLLGVVIEQLTIVLISLPSLFIAPVLIYIFGFYLNLLPVAFLDSPKHYILPVVALSLRPLASLTRLLQKSMEEQEGADYVRAARARGLSPWRLRWHHVLRNSLIASLAYLGPLMVSVLSGSFLVELLFAIPGLGSEFVRALSERDYTLICGLALVYGVMLILLNGGADLLMRWADPRMREEG